MTNDITKTAPQIVDLTDKTVCIQHGLSGKKALMDSVRAYVTYHGAIEEWFEHMGMAKSTGYRYKAQLLKEGTFKYLQEKPKSDTPDAARMRNKRANEQILTERKCSPTDDSQSSNPITPGIDHDVTNAESSNTELSFSEVVSDAQPKMGPSYHGCSQGLVPMDTTDARRAAEDLEEIVRLLNIVGQLTARNCDIRGPHFNEEQWYLVWASLDSEAREAKMRCRNYEAAIVRDCDSIRAGVQARFGS